MPHVTVGSENTGPVETDFRHDQTRIDVPVLVIQGGQDGILPPDRTGQRLPGLIKDMKLTVIEDGPHSIAWTHAEKVTKEILDFLP